MSMTAPHRRNPISQYTSTRHIQPRLPAASFAHAEGRRVSRGSASRTFRRTTRTDQRYKYFILVAGNAFAGNDAEPDLGLSALALRSSLTLWPWRTSRTDGPRRTTLALRTGLALGSLRPCLALWSSVAGRSLRADGAWRTDVTLRPDWSRRALRPLRSRRTCRSALALCPRGARRPRRPL